MKQKLVKTLGVGLCVIGVVVIGAWIYIHPGRGPSEQLDAHAKAYIETVEGLPVLHLKGAPYELGFQQGSLARDGVLADMQAFRKLLQLTSDDAGIPVFALNVLLDVCYRRCAVYIPDYAKRELEGLADGAGVDLQILRRIHVASELEQRQCSAFAVFGKATVNGKLYHGHNFDWEIRAGVQDNAALFLVEPDDGVPFAAFGYLGMVAHTSGMNMNGISVGVIGALTRDNRSAGTPFMFLLRDALQKSHNLDEASAIIAGAHRTVGYNYVISDGNAGAARAIETTGNHCAIFRENDPNETAEYAIRIEDAVFRADAAMDPTIRSYQLTSAGPPMDPDRSDSRDPRYKGLGAGIRQAYGKIDDQAGIEILKSVAMQRANVHSVLCNGTDREMWVARAKGLEGAFKQPYIHFDLKQMFLSPDKRAH